MSLDTLKLEFEHSVQEVELILAGLRKLPMEVVLELYNKIHGSAKAMVDEHLASQPIEVPADSITVTSTEQSVA